MVAITVFTPTFNRAYILDNLYRSLQRQCSYDFEWLIIDDGSTDDTELLVNSWINDGNPFPIRYYRQDNGGKCRAINRALDLANGRLFFTVDSDDYLTERAIEIIMEWENALPRTNDYCGVAGNIGYSPTTTTNKLFPGGYFDGTLLDRYKTVDGERAFVFYTEIHKKYKYPEFENECFMTEAVAWNRMAHDGYKMRFFNEIIWVFSYRDDGLTMAGHRLFIENPCGYALWLKERVHFTDKNTFHRLRINYTLISELIGTYNIKEIARIIQLPSVICWLLMKVHSCYCFFGNLLKMREIE